MIMERPVKLVAEVFRGARNAETLASDLNDA